MSNMGQKLDIMKTPLLDWFHTQYFFQKINVFHGIFHSVFYGVFHCFFFWQFVLQPDVTVALYDQAWTGLHYQLNSSIFDSLRFSSHTFFFSVTWQYETFFSVQFGGIYKLLCNLYTFFYINMFYIQYRVPDSVH